jgi:hypothetical protein
MTATPTVDRFRYPWRRMVPGDTHSIFLHWAGDPDLSSSTFTVNMVDAFTGTAVPSVTYTVNMAAANVGAISATASIPAAIDTDALYEIRVRQNGQTIIAGAVVFALPTVPVAP